LLLFQIVLLALVQGLGEFLPIGGAGPSTLVPASAGLPDQGLALGLAAHLGTLAAALLYFWRDGCRMTVGVFRLLFGRGPFEHPEAGARLALQLLAATVPAIALGAAIAHALGGALDSIPALAGVTILGGLLLVLADRTGATFRRVEDLRAVMERNGDADKQIWITEFGWTSDPVNPSYSWFAVSEELKGQYLVDAFRWAHTHWQPWIGVMVAWNMADPSWTAANEEYWWSITNPDGSPRSAFTLFAQQRTQGGLP